MGGTDRARPPGWPADLPGPASGEFTARAGGWLLDRCPPSVREQSAIRNHLPVLAWVAVGLAQAELDGWRVAYARARAELRDRCEPEALEAVMMSLEANGHVAAAALREVRLVEEALLGKVWRPKL